jgi:hypothetical protein
MKTLALLSISSLLLCSCREVITLDLDSCAPKLVVEGSISNAPGPYTIHLSRTTNYFTPNKNNPEQGAHVVLSDNTGYTETLQETLPGTYVSGHLQGQRGLAYTLLVTAQNQQYTSVSTLPDSTHIDSLREVELPTLYDNPTGSSSTVLCWFKGKPGIGNYFGFCIYLNRRLIRDIVRNPLVSDISGGGTIQHSILTDEGFKTGDTVRIELYTLNKASYEFYNALQHLFNTASPLSTPPANPPSTISNGALGHFGAFAVTSQTLVLR